MQPHEIGAAFEKRLAEAVGGRIQPGSGSKWFARLDVRDRVILWSAKATTKDRFSLHAELMEEACDAVLGPGGVGEGIGALAVSLKETGTSADEELVVMRLNDFLALMREPPIYQPTKLEIRDVRARTPQLFREA